MRSLVAVLSICAWLGCAKSLEELSPYPCGGDGSCPAPLACNAGMCGAPRPGSPCDKGDVDCAIAGPSYECFEGHWCAQTCDADEDCDREVDVCLLRGGQGWCYARCIDGGSCLDRQACKWMADDLSVCSPDWWDGVGDECGRDQDCDMVLGDAACWGGRCAKACGPDLPCPDRSTTCLLNPDLEGGHCATKCSKDSDCGDGMVCKPKHDGGKVCVPPSVSDLGGTCGRGADCALAGPGVLCWGGTCTAACEADEDCDSGRICVEGACAEPCWEVGDPCTDAEARCAYVYTERRWACTPKAVDWPTCESFEKFGACNLCGPDNYTVKCQTGDYCPRDGVCLGNNSCDCQEGFEAYACTGEKCSDLGGCRGFDWYCRPKEDTTRTCGQDVGSFVGQCICADGKTFRTECGDLWTCKDYCAPTCDPVRQACESPSEKCTINFYDNEPVVRCVPRGTALLWQPCDGEMGNDNCAEGYCFPDQEGGERKRSCLPICHRTSQCSVGRCVNAFSSTPRFGVCLPACSLGTWEPCGSGTTCGAYVNPELSRSETVCRYVGPSGEGEACERSENCGPDMHCSGGNCRPFCRTDQSSCASGSCVGLWGLENWGFCSP